MKFIILAFMIAFLLSITTVNAFPLTVSNNTIQKALEYLNNSQQNNGGFGDSASAYYSDLTPFAVMAIKAANQDPNSWSKGGNSTIYFLKNVSVPALNDSTPPTYYGVVIMALVASGENTEDIFGRNLTNELIIRQKNDGSFNGSVWITDEEWALLALVAAGYKNSPIVQNLTNYLISQQKSDGGFGAFCPDTFSSCPDETALGIMGLISAGYAPDSTVVKNAVSRLKQFQISNGGIDPGWGANVDSDAWAIQAVISLGNNFTEWVKSNYTINTSSDSYSTNILNNFSLNVNLTNYGNNYPFDHLIKLQNANTGEFNYFKPIQDTSYAIMALLGKPFPLNNTSYNQSESIGVYRNQTFSMSANQTENWNITVSNSSIQLNVEASNITLYMLIPSDSTGKVNNLTIKAASSPDELNRSITIRVSVQSLCGNNICESGESCSICSVDCGSCPTSSSGGGGGSSDTGSTESVNINWGSLTSEGITNDIILGNTATFIIQNISHNITLKELNSTAAIFEIKSTSIIVTLNLNEIKKIDLDNDNIYDLEMSLNNISGLKTSITMKPIKESYKCSPCPSSTEWSECTDSIQKRANYKCDETTRYSCLLFVEEKSCKLENKTEQESSQIQTPKSGVVTGFLILQNTYLSIIFAIFIFSAIIVFLIFRSKSKTKRQ